MQTTQEVTMTVKNEQVMLSLLEEIQKSNDKDALIDALLSVLEDIAGGDTNS